jgi:hypothetical protein
VEVIGPDVRELRAMVGKGDIGGIDLRWRRRGACREGGVGD